MASLTQSSMSLATLSNQAFNFSFSLFSFHSVHVFSSSCLSKGSGQTVVQQPNPTLEMSISLLVGGTRIFNPSSVSLSIKGRNFPSITLQSRQRRFQFRCAAKPETVKKVCDIVKKQLALPEGETVTGDSKFSALGADSLDTVEIVMGLEEEFGISVEEESAQTITTVQEAADMIDKLLTLHVFST
ncbi:Acyl carrier protein 1, chloroplastic, partial [Mucuna pruriens]